VVEYGVTTGLLGLLLLGAWLYFAGLQARGRFAWVAGALLVFHLLQPQNAVVTPLALFALGAAAPRRSEPPAKGILGRRALSSIAGVTALCLFASFLGGQERLQRAYLNFDFAAADLSYLLLKPWPEVADRRGIVEASPLDAGRSPDWDRVRFYYRAATRRDPQDPRPWLRLGSFELGRRRPRAAAVAYRRVLAIEPWSLAGSRGMLRVALAEDKPEDARRWSNRIERITRSGP